jgi:hypothetical protein
MLVAEYQVLERACQVPVTAMNNRVQVISAGLLRLIPDRRRPGAFLDLRGGILRQWQSGPYRIILKTAVGSRKSAQALDVPGKFEKALITNKVTTRFSNSPCTSISCTSFSRPTAVSRIM